MTLLHLQVRFNFFASCSRTMASPFFWLFAAVVPVLCWLIATSTLFFYLAVISCSWYLLSSVYGVLFCLSNHLWTRPRSLRPCATRCALKCNLEVEFSLPLRRVWRPERQHHGAYAQHPGALLQASCPRFPTLVVARNYEDLRQGEGQ